MNDTEPYNKQTEHFVFIYYLYKLVQLVCGDLHLLWHRNITALSYENTSNYAVTINPVSEYVKFLCQHTLVNALKKMFISVSEKCMPTDVNILFLLFRP